MSEKKKNPVGRPRKIKSPEEFDRLVDSYIDMCRANNEPILLIGMVLALGLTSKEAFYNYGSEYAEFSESVKRARSLIELEYEKRLNVNSSAAGPIFALKNFGWKDKQEVDNISSDGSMTPAPAVSISASEVKDIIKRFNDEC